MRASKASNSARDVNISNRFKELISMVILYIYIIYIYMCIYIYIHIHPISISFYIPHLYHICTIFIPYLYCLVVDLPLWKTISQWEGLSHILWKIKNVPTNNQYNIYPIFLPYISPLLCFSLALPQFHFPHPPELVFFSTWKKGPGSQQKGPSENDRLTLINGI